jgi:HD superfamily phosphohydrolase
MMKHKIINDPVYGFINFPTGINMSLVEHFWFQRLRHIRQLGLAFYVYPGAIHTRFQHSLGAYYLTNLAIDVIRSKGFEITETEATAVSTAILLHDIGHGPFSHALENILVKNVSHEDLSVRFMEELNNEFDGELTMAIDIFKNRYKKQFLHQLVSSQLDMDRLDYLKRDSFFTGVSEGVIGSDRIIKMLNVVDDRLVVEEKGVYSIEKFLIARRLMYWQVYFHKTVLATEQMLIHIFKRARELCDNGIKLSGSSTLLDFLSNSYSREEFKKNNEILNCFARLDDNDLLSAIKGWIETKDTVLSELCKRFTNRNLYKIEMQNEPFSDMRIEDYKKKIAGKFNISLEDASYFVFADSAKNHAYSADDDRINILYKSRELVDISEASDMLNIQVLSKNVIKYFFCYPEECRSAKSI